MCGKWLHTEGQLKVRKCLDMAVSHFPGSDPATLPSPRRPPAGKSWPRGEGVEGGHRGVGGGLPGGRGL